MIVFAAFILGRRLFEGGVYSSNYDKLYLISVPHFVPKSVLRSPEMCPVICPGHSAQWDSTVLKSLTEMLSH